MYHAIINNKDQHENLKLYHQPISITVSYKKAILISNTILLIFATVCLLLIKPNDACMCQPEIW